MHDTDKSLIHGLMRSELADVVSGLGEPAFRAGQIWAWLYAQRVSDWARMGNVPKGLRSVLSSRFDLVCCRVLQTEGSSVSARKLLIGLRDGETIEAVLIPAEGRRTVCVSTQVGCRFGCAFCASGQSGFRRNLEPGEMVGQILAAVGAGGEPATHVVFMGVGEPFDNYDALIRAVRIANDSHGLRIGARRMTISTCGIVPGIQRLATERIQVELSVSLHAASDALRTRLMPVNRTYPLEDLMEACRCYTESTGRIVTFEYTLVSGVNDSNRDAEALAERLCRFPCRANLIPLSVVPEFRGDPVSAPAIRRFAGIVRHSGVNCTVRNSEGAGIQAACGQLRANRLAIPAKKPLQ